MDEAKHTPGPWNASRFGCQVLTGDSWSTICELKGDARWEDGRGSYEQEYKWQIQEANACLIAAAPDLLTMLKVAQLWLDVDGRFDMQAINAAIAKAEGRQP